MAANTKILDKAKVQLALAYTDGDKNRAAAISPALVDILIQLGVSLLKSCFASGASGATVVEAAKKGNILARIQARKVVRQELVEMYGFGAWTRHGGQKIVDTLIQAGGEAEPEDVDQLAEVDL